MPTNEVSRSVPPPASGVRAGRGGWRLGMAAVTWVLLTAGAGSGVEDAAKADLRFTIRARTALQEDPLLAPLNLGVRVDGRVATLWGPVPSAELARRAVVRLQRLPELSAVRDELFLDPWADHVLDRPRVPSLRLPLRPAEPGGAVMPVTPAPQFGTPASPRREGGTGGGWRPGAAPAAATGPRDTARLGAPLPVTPAVRMPASPPSLPTSSRTPAAARVPLSLAEAVRQIQQGDERWRRMQVEIRGDRVFLSGVVYRWQDLHEFARRLTRLPGVAGVTLQSIRTDPGSP